jgi:hypothetical protein
MALGSTQSLTEISTMNISWGVKTRVGLTALPLPCADCLEIWEPQPPKTLRPVMGFLYLLTAVDNCPLLVSSWGSSQHKRDRVSFSLRASRVSWGSLAFLADSDTKPDLCALSRDKKHNFRVVLSPCTDRARIFSALITAGHNWFILCPITVWQHQYRNFVVSNLIIIHFGHQFWSVTCMKLNLYVLSYISHTPP